MAVKGANEVVEALERAQAALREATSDLERTRSALASESRIGVRDLSEELDISEEAVVAFMRTARELLGDRELSVEAARRAGMLAAAAQAWENELGPLLSSAQVRTLLGDVSRQRVDELLRSRRLIGPRDSAGRRQFPSFQFQDGRPLEPLVAAYWTIADGAVSDWTAASWCVSPDSALEGRSPARWAHEGRDSDRLLRIARQDAARLAR
jgi:hypothetical protein